MASGSGLASRQESAGSVEMASSPPGVGSPIGVGEKLLELLVWCRMIVNNGLVAMCLEWLRPRNGLSSLQVVNRAFWSGLCVGGLRRAYFCTFCVLYVAAWLSCVAVA